MKTQIVLRYFSHLLLCLGFSLVDVEAEIDERMPVVIAAPASFNFLKCSNLGIADSTNNLFKVHCDNKGGFVHSRQNRVSTFTIVDRLQVNSCALLMVKVERAWKVLFDREICEVHKVWMERQDTAIAYGNLAPDPTDYLPNGGPARYPHRFKVLSSGSCFPSVDSPKTGKILVCSECDTDYQKWMNNHPELK